MPGHLTASGPLPESSEGGRPIASSPSTLQQQQQQGSEAYVSMPVSMPEMIISDSSMNRRLPPPQHQNWLLACLLRWEVRGGGSQEGVR